MPTVVFASRGSKKPIMKPLVELLDELDESLDELDELLDELDELLEELDELLDELEELLDKPLNKDAVPSGREMFNEFRGVIEAKLLVKEGVLLNKERVVDEKFASVRKLDSIEILELVEEEELESVEVESVEVIESIDED